MIFLVLLLTSAGREVVPPETFPFDPNKWTLVNWIKSRYWPLVMPGVQAMDIWWVITMTERILQRDWWSSALSGMSCDMTSALQALNSEGVHFIGKISQAHTQLIATTTTTHFTFFFFLFFYHDNKWTDLQKNSGHLQPCVCVFCWFFSSQMRYPNEKASSLQERAWGM